MRRGSVAAALALVAALAVLCSDAWADPGQADPGGPDAGASSPKDTASKPELPPVVPRPDFMRNRPFIPDQLLKDKREGRYVTGMPAIGFDAEEGVNVGAFFEIFDNGSKDDPFFRTAPYREKIFFGGVVTSEEVWRLIGRYDRPYVADSPYRVRVDALYEDTKLNNYFGIGGDALDLVSPRTGEKFDDFDSYQSHLNQFIDPGDDGCPPTEPRRCTYARYKMYKGEQIVGVFSLERDMFGGLVRPLVGFQVSYRNLTDYTGRNVRKVSGSGKGTQLPTNLFEDCEADRIDGCNGGWDNGVRLGLAYDSRDFEPNPGRGILAEALLYLSSKAFGSADDYQRLTFSGGFFHDFFYERESVQQLIVTGRAAYNMFFDDPPFYALSQLGFTDFDRTGLGGFRTMRGYKTQRFIGKSAILLNGEVRWFFMEGTLFNQHLKPGLAAFVDTGRAYSGVSMAFKDWRAGGGVGFRLAWNLATLVSMDIGVSPENPVFYLELGTAF